MSDDMYDWENIQLWRIAAGSFAEGLTAEGFVMATTPEQAIDKFRKFCKTDSRYKGTGLCTVKMVAYKVEVLK